MRSDLFVAAGYGWMFGEVTPQGSVASFESRRLAAIFIDVVESTQLQQTDQQAFATVWSEIIELTANHICPRHGGTLLKSLGDGLMLTAETPFGAVRLANEIQEAVAEKCADLPTERRIELHAGIDYDELLIGRNDVFGHAANVAARLAGMAQPGHIVVSDRVRMDLPPEFDVRLADLGDCHLRNIEGTVRCHVLEPASARPPRPSLIAEASLHPVIAVLPPVPSEGDRVSAEIGEAFADEVIADLSRVGELRVISRLSTRRISFGTDDVVSASRDLLTAHYVLFGRLTRNGDDLGIALEFSDCRMGTVLWTDRVSIPFMALFAGDEITRGVAERVVMSVLRSELSSSRTHALSTLENYTLLLSGIASMYSLHRREFERAHELFASLADRGDRQATTLAWRAKWHVMKVVQGWSEEKEADQAAALDLTAGALDADPGNSLAHTVRGLAYTNLARRFDLAVDCFETALAINPNEPLAWLIRGALHSFSDQGAAAVQDTGQARALSPLDPNRFYKLALSAGAHLTAGDDRTALELAQASLRSNRLHHSTLRIIAAAQWRLGDEEESRNTVRRLLELAPGFTVSQYRATAPNAGFRIGDEMARILLAAGVPR